MFSGMRFCRVFGLVLLAGLAFSAVAGADGFLYVTSSPEKAAVKIDGKSLGPAPISVSLPAGSHSVEAALAAYKTAVQAVDISEGEVTRLNLNLEKALTWTEVFSGTALNKGKGNLTVITDWPAAEIYLDGARLKEKTPATLKNIAAGAHSLILVNKGYAVSRTFELHRQESLVFQEYFDPVKKGLSVSGPVTTQAAQQRTVLPPVVALKLNAAQKAASGSSTSSLLWDETDTISVAFQYRRTGVEKWESRELKAGVNEEDRFTLGKGTYEVQLVATHYKEPSGIINIMSKQERKKVGETKSTFKKTFLSDKLYSFNITYDGSFNLTYGVIEGALQ